jgi:hypothetical protein
METGLPRGSCAGTKLAHQSIASVATARDSLEAAEKPKNPARWCRRCRYAPRPNLRGVNFCIEFTLDKSGSGARWRAANELQSFHPMVEANKNTAKVGA